MDAQLISTLNPLRADQSWLDESVDRYTRIRALPRSTVGDAIRRLFTGTVRRFGPFSARGYVWALDPSGEVMRTPDPPKPRGGLNRRPRPRTSRD